MKGHRRIVAVFVSWLLITALVACNRTGPAPEQPTVTAAVWQSPTSENAKAPTVETTEVPQSQPMQEPSPEPTSPPEETSETPSQSQELSDTTPTPEPEGSVAPEEPAKSEESIGESTANQKPLTHLIQIGENLFRISLLYDLDWHQLAAANKIANPNMIFAGQSLIIPAPMAVAAEQSPATHVVQSGENLFRIGLLYNQPWDVIARANGILNPHRIVVGQELTIPQEELTTALSLPATHTIQPGENLFRIGLYFGVPWPAIAQANSILNPDRIIAGTELLIPAIKE